MIIKGRPNAGEPGRTLYPLSGNEVQVTHFVIRQTHPGNPFTPHKHEQQELWYIVSGEATYLCDGREEAVGSGDLILIEPWVEHGLRTDTAVTWICMG